MCNTVPQQGKKPVSFHKAKDIVNEKPLLWQCGALTEYCVQVSTFLHQKPELKGIYKKVVKVTMREN